MKSYHSIPYFGEYKNIDIVALDKLDGSNIRIEYSQKTGFYKFGTRTQLLDKNSEFGIAIDLFKEKYNESLSKVFKDKYSKTPSMVCYAELAGLKSAFGSHEWKNDVFDITLFDVELFQKGFLSPLKFIEEFEAFGIPKIIYKGLLDDNFINRIKNNEDDLSEGVICKSLEVLGKYKKYYYCKIKTFDWLNRLKLKNSKAFEMELNSDKNAKLNLI